MTSQPSSRLDLSALRDIRNIALSLSEFLMKTGRVSGCLEPPHNAIESSIPPFNPEFPPDILNPIRGLVIPDRLRLALLQRIGRLMKDLQDQYSRTYRETCLTTLKGPAFLQDLTTINQVYHSLFLRNCVPMLEAQIATIVTQVPTYQQNDHSSGRKPFNNDYLPMLEQYFEFNGYPSAAHRLILAEQSMMLPRQIEVWFQNHRNRAKKENKFVPRLESEIPLRRALEIIKRPDTLPIHQSRLATPPYEDPTSTLERNQQSTDSTLRTHSQILSLLATDSRPPHAYPSTRKDSYPDPFPTENGIFKFSPPTWRRRPATVPVVPTVVDMDEFARTFHLKLNFSESSRKTGTTTVKRESPSITPWFHSTTTFAPSAPHPALVRPNHPYETTSLIPNSSSSSKNPIPKPTFGLSSLFIATIPSETLSRKIRPLPRRVPQSRSQSGSRTSSFSSDISTSSDYSSPELSTPPLLPYVDLPIIQDASQPDLFDFSHSVLDANYTLSAFLPSRDLSLANTYPVSGKSTDIPFVDDAFPDFSHNLGEIIS